jgi:hypothetical protein
VINPLSKTVEEPGIEVRKLANIPPVQLSAVEIIIFNFFASEINLSEDCKIISLSSIITFQDK